MGAKTRSAGRVPSTIVARLRQRLVRRRPSAWRPDRRPDNGRAAGIPVRIFRGYLVRARRLSRFSEIAVQPGERLGITEKGSVSRHE